MNGEKERVQQSTNETDEPMLGTAHSENVVIAAMSG